MWNAQSHQIWQKSRPVAFNLASDSGSASFCTFIPGSDGIFRPQQSGGHNKLYPSAGNVVHKVADEKSSGEKRIGLERGDVDSHSLVRVGDGQVVEVPGSNAEVLREQLRGVSEAGDAAVGVMQDD